MPSFPKIFADTSSVEEIQKLTKLGIISGITTNPVIVAKEAKNELPDEYYRLLAKNFPDLPISIQLLEDSLENLVSQAHKFAKIAPNIVIKVPMFSDGKGLKVLSVLATEGIPTNVTALMKAEQAFLSLVSGQGKGPQYISLFFNRIKDGGGDPQREITTTKELINKLDSSSEIIAGSIRSGEDVYNAAAFGADIITVTPKVLWEMIEHPKTTEFIAQSQKTWEEFLAKSKVEPKIKPRLRVNGKIASA